MVLDCHTRRQPVRSQSSLLLLMRFYLPQHALCVRQQQHVQATWRMSEHPDMITGRSLTLALVFTYCCDSRPEQASCTTSNMSIKNQGTAAAQQMSYDTRAARQSFDVEVLAAYTTPQLEMLKCHILMCAATSLYAMHTKAQHRKSELLCRVLQGGDAVITCR